MSQGLKGRLLVLTTYEKEVLAILKAIKEWHQYLLSRKFVAHTDQKSINHVLDQRIDTDIQHKWLRKLSCFHFTMEYKGGENCTVDDRCGEEELHLQGVTVLIPF